MLGVAVASITSWSVADFKSLGAATLRLPHLTVLAGANSSGKSSVLQSMLLLAQSMTRGGRIVMNGQLVRLGEPTHVIREGQSAVEFRFSVHGAPAAAAEPPRAAKFEVAVSLVPSPDGTSMTPSSFEVTDAEGTVIIAATSERMRTADIDAFSRASYGQDMSFLKLKQVEGRKAPNRMYLGFMGVVPVLLARHIDPRVIARQMKAVVSAAMSAERLNYDLVSELSRLVSKKKFYKEFGLDGPASGAHQRPSQASAMLWGVRDFAALDDSMRETLLQRFVSQRAAQEWVVIGPGFPHLGYGNRIGRHYFPDDGVIESTIAEEHAVSLVFLGVFASAMESFGNRIQYLGPLRDEPRVLQGAWDERVSALPVGIRGELTAEILTRERNRQIEFTDWDRVQRKATLPDAVAIWCDYFGIGDRIEVHDHGKLGRGVELRVDGFSRDLTMIGVGASQLLPILVASLAADPGTIILIEQPELHLHPTVQSRLADFFLFARPEVRFIVETHSEYLVTRIRRRIAETFETPARVEVMFAERVSGATQVRSLALTAGGDFNEWPDGFFDAQEIDTRRIVQALAAQVGKAKS